MVGNVSNVFVDDCILYKTFNFKADLKELQEDIIYCASEEKLVVGFQFQEMGTDNLIMNII